MDTLISDPLYSNLGMFYFNNPVAIYFQLKDIKSRLLGYYIGAIVLLFIASLFFLFDPRAALIFILTQISTVVEVLGLCNIAGMHVTFSYSFDLMKDLLHFNRQLSQREDVSKEEFPSLSSLPNTNHMFLLKG